MAGSGWNLGSARHNAAGHSLEPVVGRDENMDAKMIS
jgi:hypothetical protein